MMTKDIEVLRVSNEKLRTTVTLSYADTITHHDYITSFVRTLEGIVHLSEGDVVNIDKSPDTYEDGSEIAESSRIAPGSYKVVKIHRRHQYDSNLHIFDTIYCFKRILEETGHDSSSD